MNWIAELRNEGERATKLATDLEFYSGENLRIRPKAGGTVPFLWNPAQRELHRRIEGQKAETGRVRVIVLKAREMGMRHDELTPAGEWIIPGTRAKNHRHHKLPLPQLVRETIACVPRIDGSSFVFTTTGKSPVWLGSKIKYAIDEAMGNVVPHWRVHDLRRTCASGMQRLGVRGEVIERLLNHVSGSFAGVAGVYQRDPLIEEVEVALLRWSQHVAGLVSDDKNVVILRRANQ
jgi:integrase